MKDIKLAFFYSQKNMYFSFALSRVCWTLSHIHMFGFISLFLWFSTMKNSYNHRIYEYTKRWIRCVSNVRCTVTVSVSVLQRRETASFRCHDLHLHWSPPLIYSRLDFDFTFNRFAQSSKHESISTKLNPPTQINFQTNKQCRRCCCKSFHSNCIYAGKFKTFVWLVYLFNVWERGRLWLWLPAPSVTS